MALFFEIYLIDHSKFVFFVILFCLIVYFLKVFLYEKWTGGYASINLND